MNDELLSPSQFADLLGKPPSVSAAWDSFALQVIDPPLHVTTAFADHVLGLHISGSHYLHHNCGGRSAQGRSDPGAVHVYPAGVKATFDASAACRNIVLFIPDAFLSRVIAEHWEADPGKVELICQFLGRDRVIEEIMTRLSLEAKTEAPTVQLYAESACEFLAHHIVHRYSSLSTPPVELS